MQSLCEMCSTYTAIHVTGMQAEAYVRRNNNIKDLLAVKQNAVVQFELQQ
jgi:hypothetical protein